MSIRTALLEDPKSQKDSGDKLHAPGSAGKEKASPVVKNWTSKFYCATEEGDLIYSDWIAEKATEEKGFIAFLYTDFKSDDNVYNLTMFNSVSC